MRLNFKHWANQIYRMVWRRPLSARQIYKISKLAANPFAQSEVRMQKMQRLLDDGSEAAIAGVLRRFAANAHGTIADEDEKKWLEDALVRLGEPAKLPLQNYIAFESKLTYALAAYTRIVGETQAFAYCMQVLQRYGPEDHRSSEAKQQLIAALLQECTDAANQEELAHFLLDHSDDVRFATLEAFSELLTQKKLTAQVRPRLVGYLGQLLGDTSTSARIARRAAELALDSGLSLGPLQLSSCLTESYFLDKKQILRRRPNLASVNGGGGLGKSKMLAVEKFG